MKKLLSILALLSTLPFAQNSTDACAQMSEKVNKEALESGNYGDYYCVKKYFTELANKGDVNKLKKELQKVICFFDDKPNFNSTDFIRSCFNLGDHREPLRDPVYTQIERGNTSMVDYLISATNSLNRGYMQRYMHHAIEVFAKNKNPKTAEIAKMLQQKYGQKISSNSLIDIIENGDLETIKSLHEQGINLQGNCEAFSGPCYKGGGCSSSCENPIDMAAKSSKKIYQYLSEQGYKTMSDLAQEQEAAKREAKRKNAEAAAEQIQNAIKANKLGEAVDICNSNILNYYAKVNGVVVEIGPFKSIEDEILEICYKDLVSKIRKLPLNKISSNGEADIYFSQAGYTEVRGTVIQNDGKMALLSTLGLNEIFMLQHSGKCTLSQRQIFSGYAKPLGNKTYTTVTGARQSVPNYQLLWCGN